MIDPIEAIAFYAVFVFAVTVHEASHAWAAMIGGDLTAYHGGQVSLDPIPHMKRETFGMVILPVLTLATMGWPMGYASAPYSVAWAQQYPRRAAWMALAGPASNLALAVIAAVIVRVGVGMGTFEAPMSIGFRQVTTAISAGSEPGGLAAAFAMLLSLFFSMNLLLFLLNMIPFPPLDGAGALPLLLPESWVERYQDFARNPMFSLIGLILMWNLIGEIFYPVFYAAVGLLYPGVTYG
ncbi:MAG: site-2 protease family protein [Myxococcota bacterium]